MKKIEIKSTLGKILFVYEKENNTIKDTLEEAIRCGANLHSANLHSANLSFANLSFANLSFANLSFANLHSANLSLANLSFANLSFANLSFANLSSANLHSANLSLADLSLANLSFANLPIICKWNFGFKDDNILIGCENKSIADWEIFFNSEKELTTKRGTEDFKRIQATYEALKAYKLFMDK